jgi:hypothetical protein
MRSDAVATQPAFGVLCHQVMPFLKHPKSTPIRDSDPPSNRLCFTGTHRAVVAGVNWNSTDCDSVNFGESPESGLDTMV